MNEKRKIPVGRAPLLPIAALMSLALACAGPDRTERPPDIILISFCSMRADHLGMYGYGRETSPNLDLFAENATIVEDAVTPWPKTSPSFCSIMTGAYPHETGVLWKTAGVALDDRNRTLAEILKERGYTTAAFISSGALSPRLNIDQGFDLFAETWKESRRRSYPLSVRYDRAATEALAWLDEDGDDPFFLWVHFNNAHYPYKAPIELIEPFLDDSLYADTLRLEIGIDQNRDLSLPGNHPNASQILHNDLGLIPKRGALPRRPGSGGYHDELAMYVASYDGGIRWADRSAGILLDGLGERGLVDRSITIVIADHGESLGDHDFYFEHGRFTYDATLRVPFLIRYPVLFEGGRRLPGPAGISSLTPTLLEIIGEPIPRSVSMPSLLPLLTGGEGPGFVLSEGGYEIDFQIALRRGGWKLIHVPNERDRAIMGGTEFELYALGDDPGETRNLAAERTEVLDRMRDELLLRTEGWRVETEAEPTPEELGVDEATLENLRSMGYIR